ncbi:MULTISPECIES: YlxR family protein [Corynebacterium]|uniref:YlxR family protein n=1 Tax=Corynebacterium TaxID=1716 RepID=UPI0011A962BB|nr:MULTISPECIES: YlxR family protein [Corynebacterium]MCQ9675491.1 YlxR family protein [Corynebacterium sp. BF-R-2]
MSQGQRLRTCIATRQKHPDTELLRVVADRDDPEGRRVVPDPRRQLPGRGAWIRPDLEAVALAERTRAFKRALRMSTDVDTGHVREYLAAQQQVPSAGVSPCDPELKRKTEH